MFGNPEVGFASFFNDAIVRVEYTEPTTNLTLIVEEKIPNFLKDGLIYNLGVGRRFRMVSQIKNKGHSIKGGFFIC